MLELLNNIDKDKNWITREEEQATHLADAINGIVMICELENPTDKESLRVAMGIQKNFQQRFYHAQGEGRN